MSNPIRSLLLHASLLVGITASAQHTIYVVGQMSPCDPSLAGTNVNIHVYGHHSGPVAVSTPLSADCSYYLEMLVPDTAGIVFVGATCVGGNFIQDSALYTLQPPFTTDVVVNLGCGEVTACDACFTMEQTAPFSATFDAGCSAGGTGNFGYLWDFSSGGTQEGLTTSHTFPGPGAYAVCLNLSDDAGCTDGDCQQVYVDEEGNLSFEQPTDCQACLEIEQTEPFIIQLNSCSSGNGTLFNEWQLPNGSFTFGASATFTFTEPGVYMTCLHLTSNTGCYSVACDSIVVTPDGWVSQDSPWYDCVGALWGADTTGAPCNVNGVQGYWNSLCECEAVTVTPCDAGFWPIQAWHVVGNASLPIPNELWIWNLSSGMSPYAFVWDFGDGNTSTEAFPTHTYAGTGPYELCLTITDDVGCSDTYCDLLELDEEGFLNGMVLNGAHGQGNQGARSGLTINVIQGSPTGLTPKQMAPEFSLYPNPVADELQLRLAATGNYNVEVRTVDGRLLRSERINFLADQAYGMDVSTLLPGIYLLQLTDGEQRIVRRFVKR